MGSRCHAHMVPGHREIEEIRQALAAHESSGLRRGWRTLIPYGADLAAEISQDLVEEILTWRIPSPEELGDVLGAPEASIKTLTDGFGKIAAVLASGEIWVVHSEGDAEPQTLVVGMSVD